ncbi:hypothetical protein GCM10009415_44030 [Chitinophaga japonensis]
MRAWTDNTGGKSHELAFSQNSNIYVRSGFAPTWEKWRRLISEDVNGNVGIGTTNPGTYKLAVEGTIGARKVKVTQSGWADFVFHPDYQLPSLYEIEKYITTNRHLPDIPAAAEVEQEGLDLGEMDKKLLQKIEELTLYIIRLNKKNEALEQRVAELEQQSCINKP